MTGKKHGSKLLVGLPRTGKSTFLVALFNVLESEEIQASLGLSKLSEDFTYLTGQQSTWLACQRLNRTLLQDRASVPVSFHLVAKGEAPVEMFVPDISGEEFSHLWVNRQCPKELADIVEQSDGILLFVNPNDLQEPECLTEVNEAAQELYDSVDDVESAEADGDEQTTNDKSRTTEDQEGLLPEDFSVTWDLKKCPTQVALVELLQFLIEDLNLITPARVAVIVSAWDTIHNDAQPESWLEKRLPLLNQFLLMREDVLESRVYGVSAQGGRLPQDRERLLAIRRPSERLIVKSGGVQSHDITLPIRWLMS